MKEKLRFLLLLTLVLLLFLAQTVSAMSSDHYVLNWYTPLTTSGGGRASSANYSINLTIGQTTIGNASNTNYHLGLGYWAGLIDLLQTWIVQLPIILK
jgi:hypothetical protein